MLDLTNIRTTAAPGIQAPADAVRRRPRHSSVRTSFHLRRLLERLPPPPPPTHSLGRGHAATSRKCAATSRRCAATEEVSCGSPQVPPPRPTQPRTPTDDGELPRTVVPSECDRLSHSKPRKRSDFTDIGGHDNSPRPALPRVRGCSLMVGDTGFEPMTSSVSSIPRPSVDVRGRQAEHDPVPQGPPKSVRTHLRCQAVSQARASGAEPRLEVGPTAMAGRDPPVCTLALK